jgi:uncharacterized glyoxalase superfamily protein PhnB
VVAEGNVPVDSAHLVMVRVPDADSHHERARQHGARIVAPPNDHSYGERQYNAQDSAVIAGRLLNQSPTSLLSSGVAHP